MTATKLLFADSNIFIEALLIPDSAAFVIAEWVAMGIFDLATCKLCIKDVEKAIINKTHDESALDDVIKRWEKFKLDTRLRILNDPDFTTVKKCYDDYIASMRHKADIPVLASALNMNPAPTAILSNNREHFNDVVSQKCGILICSCPEFINTLGKLQL